MKRMLRTVLIFVFWLQMAGIVGLTGYWKWQNRQHFMILFQPIPEPMICRMGLESHLWIALLGLEVLMASTAIALLILVAPPNFRKRRIEADQAAAEIALKGQPVEAISCQRELELRERKLAQQEAFLRSIYDGVEEAIFVVDVEENGDFRYVSTNTAHQRLTGISLNQIQGKMAQELGVPEWKKVVQHYQNCVEQRSSFSYEEAITVNGTETNWYTTLTPLFDQVDRVHRIIGTSTLIDSLKQTELKLRRALHYIDLHFENSPLAIIEWDVNDHPVRWSKQAEQIFGWTAEEVKGCYLQGRKFVYEEDQDRIYRLTEAMYQGKLPGFAIQNRNYTKDGRVITCAWYNSSVYNEAGDLVSVLSFVQDITDRVCSEAERKRQEADLQQAKEAAEAANRAKSLFLANMSHELRTPLNAILGFTQLLQRDPQLTPVQREQITIVNRNGEHLLSLINEVLSIAKIEADQRALNVNRFDLPLFLNQLVETFQPLAMRKGLGLRVERSADLPQWIRTDEAKLRQILNNLLDNAIKFTRSGQVILRVEPTFQPDFLQFTVTDTGCGIEGAEIATLFEAFVQTQSGRHLGQGTGLGLFICRRLVQLLGGEIQVNSRLAEGTTFQFQILAPAGTPGEHQATLAPRVVGLAPDQPRYQILVVDDVENNRLCLVYLLQAVGFEVIQAATGQEAINQWQQHQPQLVLLDLRLPDRSGYEVAQQIREMESSFHAKVGKTCSATTHPGVDQTVDRTVLIAISASLFEEDQQQIFSSGFDDSIGKPCSETLIFTMIGKYLPVTYEYAVPVANPVMDSAGIPLSAQVSAPEIASHEVEAALRQMSSGWRQQLYRASIAGDDEMALRLVAQMPESQMFVRTRLTKLIHEFQLEEILLWLESVPL